jgi:hypothetical protein
MRLLSLLALGAVVGAPLEALAAAEPSGPDPRLSITCAVGKRGRPFLLRGQEQITNGIVHEERVTRDETHLELVWRHLTVKRWAGHSFVPEDLARCQPVLVDDDGLVVVCGSQEAEKGHELRARRLVRLRSGQEPVRLGSALSFPGALHVEPLGEGRVLTWAESGDNVHVEWGLDDLTAAEIDATGTVVHTAAISRPYIRRWPAGRAFVLVKQPPVTSGDPATYWRAEWNGETHGLDFNPEPGRARLGVCRSGSGVIDSAAARLQLSGSDAWPAVASLGEDAAGVCVRAVATRFRPDQGGAMELRAEAGRLRGRVWLVSGVAKHGPHGATHTVPKITPADVTCELRPPS